MSNVVYKFSCSRDVSTSYIRMKTSHLGTKIQEHLHIHYAHDLVLPVGLSLYPNLDIPICSESKQLPRFHVLFLSKP